MVEQVSLDVAVSPQGKIQRDGFGCVDARIVVSVEISQAAHSCRTVGNGGGDGTPA